MEAEIARERKGRWQMERERDIYIKSTRRGNLVYEEPRFLGSNATAWLIARHPGHTRRSSRVTPSFALSGKLPFRDAVASGAAYTRVLFRKQKGATREFAGDKALWPIPLSSIAVPPSGREKRFEFFLEFSCPN